MTTELDDDGGLVPLRDRFAGQVLQGLYAGALRDVVGMTPELRKETADFCYAQADDMLRARRVTKA